METSRSPGWENSITFGQKMVLDFRENGERIV